MEQQLHVLIVSESRLFRDCLAAGLKQVGNRFRIDTATGAGSLERPAKDKSPDAVLVDLQGANSFNAPWMAGIRQHWPGARVLLIGPAMDEDEIVAHLAMGAADYRIAGDESPESLCVAIRDAIQGTTEYSPERTRALFMRLRSSSGRSGFEGLEMHGLTERELQVLRLLDEGKSNRQIAAMLHISLHTVKNHVHRVLEELDVKKRGEAVHSAYVHGWLETRRLFTRPRSSSGRIGLEGLEMQRLTERELQVLRLLDEGKSNRQIAATLHISLHTVKNHVHRILEKLKVKKRGEAVHSAYVHGWLETRRD